MAGLLNENEKGQFEPVKEVSSGVWCTKCEFFEIDITVEDIHAEGSCASCGCIADDHDNAKVVTL